MSKPSNPTLIGSFVLGAVLLLVAAVLLFGGAALFASKRTVVSYFPGSVKGLREGSTVALNGVRIGYVENMQLQGELMPDKSMDMLVKVTMEVLPGSFELLSNGAKLTRNSALDDDAAAIRRRRHPRQARHGELRHRTVAGGTRLRPDLPAVFRAREKGGPPEIPTIPGDVQQVLERLQTFFAQVSEQIDGPRS